jgi:hypothetical protein
MIRRSRGSSVSVVSDYGLEYRAIGVRSPTGAMDISSNLSVQTGSEAHPDSCTMGTGGHSPGRDANHSPSSTAEVMSRSYTSSPSKHHMACKGTTFGP